MLAEFNGCVETRNDSRRETKHPALERLSHHSPPKGRGSGKRCNKATTRRILLCGCRAYVAAYFQSTSQRRPLSGWDRKTMLLSKACGARIAARHRQGFNREQEIRQEG